MSGDRNNSQSNTTKFQIITIVKLTKVKLIVKHYLQYTYKQKHAVLCIKY